MREKNVKMNADERQKLLQQIDALHNEVRQLRAEIGRLRMEKSKLDWKLLFKPNCAAYSYASN